MTNKEILSTLDAWWLRRLKVMRFRELMNIADRPAGRLRKKRK